MGQNDLSFDWVKLAAFIGEDHPDNLTLAKAAWKKLITAACDDDTKVASDVRNYLIFLEIGETCGECKSFYKALREIEHDVTMLRYVAYALERLWT